MRELRFAGKFLLVLTGVIATLLLFRISFAFSRWAGFLIVGVFTIVLYVTAHRWVRWLPSLLIFGVINALLVLVTHKAPTNPGVTVSTGVAGLLLVFYAIGCVVAYYYDAAHLSAVDRCAWLVYLCCLIWPALAAHKDVVKVTSDIAWSVSVGVTALIAAFATRRMRI